MAFIVANNTGSETILLLIGLVLLGFLLELGFYLGIVGLSYITGGFQWAQGKTAAVLSLEDSVAVWILAGYLHMKVFAGHSQVGFHTWH